MNVRRDKMAEDAVTALVTDLKIVHIDPSSLRVVRSDSEARVLARIWGVNRVLQAGLEIGPTYIIELVDPNFNKLDCNEKIKTVVHELTHIPSTFSGYVRPHNRWFHRDLRKYLNRLRKLPTSRLEEICSLLGGK
jgi:predicted metallopeptidase